MFVDVTIEIVLNFFLNIHKVINMFFSFNVRYTQEFYVFDTNICINHFNVTKYSHIQLRLRKEEGS